MDIEEKCEISESENKTNENENEKENTNESRISLNMNNIFQFVMNKTYPAGTSKADKREIRRQSKRFELKDSTLYYVARGKISNVLRGHPVSSTLESMKQSVHNAYKGVCTDKKLLFFNQK